MSNTQETTAPARATPQSAQECSDCGGSTGVREAGQEAVEPVNGEQSSDKDKFDEKESIVMSGPLGAAVTEALNKALKKNQAATESLSGHVQANGQIHNSAEFISKISRSVGAVPATSDSPTVVNTMLDAASKVDQVDFVFIHSTEPSVSEAVVAQKAVLAKPGEALEGFAVESVELVVKVRKIKK